MKKIKEVRNDAVNASIMTQEYVIINGVEYYSDDIDIKQYHNSKEDRRRLMEEQPEEIVNGILAVWGEEPTIIEPRDEFIKHNVIDTEMKELSESKLKELGS